MGNNLGSKVTKGGAEFIDVITFRRMSRKGKKKNRTKKKNALYVEDSRLRRNSSCFNSPREDLRGMTIMRQVRPSAGREPTMKKGPNAFFEEALKSRDLAPDHRRSRSVVGHTVDSEDEDEEEKTSTAYLSLDSGDDKL